MSLRWPAACANFLEQLKFVYITKRLNRTLTGVVWDTDMATVSLFWNTNMVRIVLFPWVKLFFCRANKHMKDKKISVWLFIQEWLSTKEFLKFLLTAARLAQSVERLTAEQEVAGSIPGTGPTLRYSLCTASGWTFAWLGWPRKMTVSSPVG